MNGIVKQIWSSPTGRLGFLLSTLIIAFALFAPWLSTHDPNKIDVMNRLAPPTVEHWMGTDQVGRDLYSRIVYGSRIAMGVALTVIFMALSLGTILGIAAAYSPGQGERIVLIIFDIVSSFPSLVFALAVVAILGPGLFNVILIVAISLVPHFGRVARAQVLILKHRPFLEAERLLGASRMRIVMVHVLPNVMGPLVVLASMDIPVVITIEAGLSFLGVGVMPPLASWGTLLHDGYTYLNQSFWPVLFAGLMLTLATLGFTLFGEALRDAIDPKLKTKP